MRSSKTPFYLYLYIFLLACIGFVVLYLIEQQTVEYQQPTTTFWDHTLALKQLIWFCISVLLCISIHFFVSVQWLNNFAFIFYGLNIILLIITIFIAPEVRGSRSWIHLGGFTFQPAELSKLLVLLCLSRYTAEFKKLNTAQHQIVIFGIIAICASLIIIQKEVGQVLIYFGLIIPLVMRSISLTYFYFIVGNAMTIYLIFAVDMIIVDTFYITVCLLIIVYHLVYQRFDIKKIFRYMSAGFTLLIIFIIYHFFIPLIVNNALETHHVRRIVAIVDATEKKRDWMNEKTKKTITTTNFKSIKYNVRQAEIAIGSGGLIGKGFQGSTQTRLAFVPEQHSDFIFSAVGEIWGLVGCMLILLLYFLILQKILFLARKANSLFHQFFIYGIFGYLLINITINIGMVLGFLPVVGLPLPWLSYGGSSFIINSVLIAIAIKMSTANKYA